MNEISVRETLGNAIRYWELRRMVYNALLAVIVVLFFVRGLPDSRAKLTVDLAQALFVLAVLANVAYCAAYPVDVFAQLSSVRAVWLRVRWIVFAIGLAFAGIITRYIAEGMFRNAV
jgi:hypothetical protein